jgi:hypothetical protein
MQAQFHCAQEKAFDCGRLFGTGTGVSLYGGRFCWGLSSSNPSLAYQSIDLHHPVMMGGTFALFNINGGGMLVFILSPQTGIRGT